MANILVQNSTFPRTCSPELTLHASRLVLSRVDAWELAAEMRRPRPGGYRRRSSAPWPSWQATCPTPHVMGAAVAVTGWLIDRESI